ncbi:MAG: ribosome biogenesis GTPase Der, partial [Acidimicrobiia bacterium]
MKLPLVAVVGRPNVGKSTLVNRLLGRREAIVEAHPGVTRDRKVVEVEWAGRKFCLVDTGGWLSLDEPLSRQVSLQAERAVAEADAVVLVVDATVGPTTEDAQVAELLKRASKPAIVAVNKVDDASFETDAWAFSRLGLGEPLAVSALHGRGSGDLLDEVLACLGDSAPLADPLESSEPDESPADSAPRTFSVAIVGRPNVGKSTLFNRLVGEERAVVHDEPGTTRDAVDTVVETESGPLRFVDTAGMRRKARISEGTEYYGLVRALQALDRADAALIVIDSTEGVTAQDQRLAERVDAAGCAAVVVLNKWDLLDTEAREEMGRQTEDRLGFLGHAPVLRVSALTGRSTARTLPILWEALSEYRRRVPTRALNQVLIDAQAAHPPPVDRGKRPRVLYGTQG